jgi:hypothetical protein
VNREEQLRWEARWARPAGIGGIVAALIFLVSRFLLQVEDREGIERYPDDLLSIDESPAGYFGFTVLPGVASMVAAGAFYVLFRATQARGGGMPRWLVYLVVGAPVLFTIGHALAALELLDVAERFADQDTIRGEAGDEKAEDLTDPSPGVLGLQSAGNIALAFVYVMVPLRARRVGLLSPFMSILGVISGLLIVFATLDIAPIIQAFWLGALGMLVLGNWPGGRGPAWESGEAEPWPTAAQRRGLAPMPGEEPRLDPSAPPPEPAPERPASRKRRSKRR